MGEDAILAFTRVLGAAAANVAESAIALFFAELGPGTVREGPDELARAKLSEAATAAFTSVPDVLGRMVMDAFGRAQRRAEEARSWLAPFVDAEGPTEIVALGFVDLVGSTAWAQTLNLREQNLALTRFESAAWSSAVRAGGRLVKTIGDEVFFAAPTADAACRIGVEVCRAAAEDDVLPPARGAVGIGAAIPREGDYFGPLVNLLARLVKVGAPGRAARDGGGGGRALARGVVGPSARARGAPRLRAACAGVSRGALLRADLVARCGRVFTTPSPGKHGVNAAPSRGAGVCKHRSCAMCPPEMHGATAHPTRLRLASSGAGGSRRPP